MSSRRWCKGLGPVSSRSKRRLIPRAAPMPGMHMPRSRTAIPGTTMPTVTITITGTTTTVMDIITTSIATTITTITITRMLMTTNEPDPAAVGGGMTADEAKALYRLMTWLSPSFPVGAYSYSSGIEWAVEAGDITDA